MSVDAVVYSTDPPHISKPRLNHLHSPDPDEIHRMTEGRVTVKYANDIPLPIWILSANYTSADSELFVEYMAKFHPPPDRTTIAVSCRTEYLNGLLSEDYSDEEKVNIRAVLAEYAAGTIPKREPQDCPAVFFQGGKVVQPPLDKKKGSIWSEPAHMTVHFAMMNAPLPASYGVAHPTVPPILPPGSQIYGQQAGSNMARMNAQVRLQQQQGGNGSLLNIYIYNNTGSDVVTLSPTELIGLG